MLNHAGVTDIYFEREARGSWALFKTLTDGKPLRDASRDDGRLLVQHFEQQGLKSATIQKKVAWLKAACNLAIKEGRLKFNPFSSIVPRKGDKQARLPLTEMDMRAIRSGLDRLDKADALLFRFLACTGARLSEAFEIASEQYELLGHETKTVASGYGRGSPVPLLKKWLDKIGC